ncbi:glutamate receptor U1-like, partial [Panulirus ornatus]|uniref:glutamate receptor U1-like n=1 Tax=Panulirus ornatus TaxID=150431 RepID=UPI003A8C76DF
IQLFPDKFTKFLQRPSLVVTSEQFASHRLVMVDDPMAPGGKRVTFVGTMEKFINYLSTALNFTYTYVRPPDGAWGTRQSDGSWPGMVGVVVREEADIGLGPFTISAPRAEVVDFTYPITLHYLKLLAALGDHEVDPWGFLLPLAPLVWLAILTALPAVPTMMFLLSSFISRKRPSPTTITTNAFNTIRILLQQGNIGA